MSKLKKIYFLTFQHCLLWNSVRGCDLYGCQSKCVRVKRTVGTCVENLCFLIKRFVTRRPLCKRSKKKTHVSRVSARKRPPSALKHAPFFAQVFVEGVNRPDQACFIPSCISFSNVLCNHYRKNCGIFFLHVAMCTFSCNHINFVCLHYFVSNQKANTKQPHPLLSQVAASH